MKLKYLRHPLRTLRNFKGMVGARLSMRSFAYHGRRKFKGDSRYDLQNVTAGFAPRREDTRDQTAILDRICAAYQRAVNQQTSDADPYRSTEWWKQVTRKRVASVRKALLERDIETLQRMYGDFYRDPCSTGLLGVPYGMSKAYFGGPIKDIHRHFFLSHVLYRLDYWAQQTDGRYVVADLAGPALGNPFGAQFGETLVRVGAEYAHYCAHRIGLRLGAENWTVAEIGGGYGGMAYYLLRDHPGITYLDFDVPESLALTAYYLMNAFPDRKFLLYGEQELSQETMDAFDVILMPLIELEKLPEGSVDVCFSSHAMSDLTPEALDTYLTKIARFTRDSLIYIGKPRTGELMDAWMTQKRGVFKLADSRFSGWHSHKVSGAGVGGAAGLAAAVMYERCYARDVATESGSG